VNIKIGRGKDHAQTERRGKKKEKRKREEEQKQSRAFWSYTKIEIKLCAP